MSAKLSWSHYDEILRFDDINKITYYINVSQKQNLSIRQLREKIKSNEYERLSKETKEKMQTVSAHLSWSHYCELLSLKEYEIKYYIRTTLYLESNVEIVEGNGSENNPYIINL